MTTPAKTKPAKVKPVMAWAVVRDDQIQPYLISALRRITLAQRFHGERIIRVKIVPVEKAR